MREKQHRATLDAAMLGSDKMAVYTVHEPPGQGSGGLSYAMRFVFIRDAFSWGAFLFGPFWMLRHRMWLMLAIYLGAAAVLGVAARLVGGSSGLWIFLALLVALFLGVEGASLRRWTLDRRGWSGRGVVIGDDLEAAERRYFDAWIARERSPRAVPRVAAGGGRVPASGSPEVIGLFPESGVRP